jgi:ATP-dependent Clp endopeptidase proteolytic subunit ClpP
MGMKGWYTIKAASSGNSADISIYEEIGGWGITAQQFSEDLKALGDITHINLHIHSPGGDVFDGIAIYNLLNKHPAKVTVHIDGLAASMASVIAMAGDRIVMPENALMMIHKPWGISGGNANDMRDYAELLDKVESVLIPAYARKTGKSAEVLGAMLESETWMDGRECVAQGFADELLPAVSAMACIESKRIEDFEYMPKDIKGMITTPKGSTTTAAPEQNRINGIKDLFAMFGGKHDSLKMQCLEDVDCTPEKAKDMLLAEMGKTASPSNKASQTHIYVGTATSQGQYSPGLNARLGHERAERGNPYAMMSLLKWLRPRWWIAVSASVALVTARKS